MILITCYADDKTRSAAMAGGDFCFLVNPVEIHRLIRSMRLALSSRTLVDFQVKRDFTPFHTL